MQRLHKGQSMFQVTRLYFIILYLTYRQKAGNDERRSDKCDKACYDHECMHALPAKHKRFSLLIGLNDIVHYDVR